MSDSIYGKAPKRYVCMPRLEQMLDYEYSELTNTLEFMGDKKKFFVYANTVEAINYSKTNKSHGWMGFRFQDEIGGAPNDVIIHVRMLDNDNLTQQQALGMLGVNLIYGCVYHRDDPNTLMHSLMDNISYGRIQIDMIKMEGPAFEGVDNRLLSLYLVKNKFADAVMFNPEGHTVHPTEVLYKKDILALRGRFRPVTHVHLDMLKNGLKMFEKDKKVDPSKIEVITELTLKDLGGEEEINEKDFLDRVDILCALGQTVLISNFQEYYKLVKYLTRYNTGAQIGLVLGANSLINIFNEKYYKKLNGELLEAFGYLFHKDLRLYLYPYKFGKELITSENMLIPEKYEHLYKFLIENKKVVDYKDYDEKILHIFSHKVLDMIRDGDSTWELLVPPVVKQIIKDQHLFQYGKAAAAKKSSEQLS